MTTQNNTNAPEFYRFQAFQGEIQADGTVKKLRTVGMAYLKQGQSLYTLRLWTLLNDRFYILPNKNDPARYLVMTREPNKNPLAKNKYFWNIVGNGRADSTLGAIRIQFDLLEKPIFLGLFPESSARSMTLSPPEIVDNFEEAA